MKRISTLALATIATGFLITGCDKKTGDTGNAGGGKKTTIANIGSDTMVNLATAWADAYGKVEIGRAHV